MDTGNRHRAWGRCEFCCSARTRFSWRSRGTEAARDFGRLFQCENYRFRRYRLQAVPSVGRDEALLINPFRNFQFCGPPVSCSRERVVVKILRERSDGRCRHGLQVQLLHFHILVPVPSRRSLRSACARPRISSAPLRPRLNLITKRVRKTSLHKDVRSSPGACRRPQPSCCQPSIQRTAGSARAPLLGPGRRMQ